MNKRLTIAALPGLLAIGLFVAGCRDVVSPEPQVAGTPSFGKHHHPPPPPSNVLAFTVQPNSAEPTLPILPCTPGSEIFTEVSVVDGDGNPVPSFTGSVSVSIGNNGGFPLPGTLFGTTTVNAVGGVAQFGPLCIDQINLPGDEYTLIAASAGLTSVESEPFSIGIAG